AVSGVVGQLLLWGVTLGIRDLPAVAAAQNPFIAAMTGALGERLGNALVWIAMAAMWFCGLSSVTSNSRMLFAFARDGGLPFSTRLARVSKRFQSPHVAVWVSAAAALVLAVSASAYTVVTALSTLALYASYGLPILLGMLARRRGAWSVRGPWDLGRHSAWVNGVALAWIAFACVLFVVPPNQSVAISFAVCLALVAVLWFGWMRQHFRGPTVGLDAQGRVVPIAARPLG
ncbi:MAG: amino acid permease, partial [Deltaproteobacteria bacterium]|nr:amino acid permease [Deltaproteobacteria bacterium]